MKKLHPNSVWIFFTKGFVGFMFGIIFILASTGGMMGYLVNENTSLFYLLLTAILTSTVFAFIYAQLSYENYEYKIDDDGFKKESGIIWKNYVTIPYNKIQNVDIFRGIVARSVGVSELRIHTAGYSDDRRSEGVLPGISIEEANYLRDELVKKMKGV